MHDDTNSEVRDTLLIAGGLALLVFGAEMILTNPAIRRVAVAGLKPLLPEGNGAIGGSAGGLLPDIERYMRLKAM